MNSDWDKDFSFGLEGETLVEELLTRGKTVEVKRDARWRDTGNLYIEYACFYQGVKAWKPSGIAVTKADYWAFVIEGTVLFVPLELLKKTCMTKGRKIDCIIPPNPSKGFLVTVQDILDVVRAHALS
jgi:hypothetical protein